MKKALVFILCLSVFIGVSACKKAMMPDNATQWLEKFEAIGKESVEVAKKAKVLDRADQAAVEAHNKAGIEFQERLNGLLEEGKKIGDSLPAPLQKVFTEKITGITEAIEAQKAALQ